MKRIFLYLTPIAAFLAAGFFPHEVRDLLAPVAEFIGLATWPLIVLGMLVVTDVIKVPPRTYTPRMSWWQALKETVTAMLNGKLADELRRLPR